MNISYEMLGIIATFVILGSVLAVTGANTIDFELDNKDGHIPPQINAGTSTATPNAYYEWCFQFEKDCK